MCLVVDRDDHDGSARRDTAIAPPRQICGCSDSISRRDIKKGTLRCCCSLPSSFFKMGLVGRHSSSSPRDPAARILIPIVAECNHLADQKKPAVPLPAGQEKCRINNLNSESRCPQSLGGGRERNGRKKPPRARPHLWRRNPISSTSSRSPSFSEDSSDINDGETIQSDIRGGVRKKERKEEEVINGGRGRRCC